MKPYRTIPILECGEPLVPIPHGRFAFYDPHPYVSVGAPYGDASPWMLRQSVLAALEKAQDALSEQKSGWTFLLFDAYRPNAVQAFMVEREYKIVAKADGLDYANLSPDERERLSEKVFRLWGIPSEDPKTPPPHSTGGAIDLTLKDETGKEVDMGSPIDENSDRSNPDYYGNVLTYDSKAIHENRLLLRNLMVAQGFRQHLNEWWHFSLGDQYWAWRQRETQANQAFYAVYGGC